MQPPEYLYKILSISEWNNYNKTGDIRGKHDDSFIHLSTKEQLPRIVGRFFKDEPHEVLALEASQLVGKLVCEKNPGGETFYWHLYRD